MRQELTLRPVPKADLRPPDFELGETTNYLAFGRTEQELERNDGRRLVPRPCVLARAD